MILSLFRISPRRSLILRIHGDIVAAARRPELYVDMAVPDTFEGRFECLVLHASLVWRRLWPLGETGRRLAQDLVDALFSYFDAILREAGIGDPSVPKKMKRLAEAYYGRRAAYDEALARGDMSEVETVLARNVYGKPASAVEPLALRRLASYVKRLESGLAACSDAEVLIGAIRFPEPSGQAQEVER
jgi:cytochrome b pre-mRNA-processing protein 3